MFDYPEVKSGETLTTSDGSLKEHVNLQIQVDNNALKIRHDNFGRLVTLDGSLYTAQEIVFHTPSEHTINGKRFDMEVQIIHSGQTSGDVAKHAILSFLFVRKPGAYNKFIDDIDFFSLPNPLFKIKDLENNISIPKIFYSSSSDEIPLMKDFSFYTYQGSLTAPPCTEKTIVYVAADPIPLGSTAIQLIQEALRKPDMMKISTGDIIKSNNNVENYRSTQKLNGRNVYFYEAKNCIINQKAQSTKQGHFERVDKEVTQYFYVNGEKPSSMPNAFVVSKSEATGN